MEIIFYIALGIFALLGIGLIHAGTQKNYKNYILVAAGLCYLTGAHAAYFFESWWPLLTGFICAWILRSLAGKKYS